MAGTNIQKKTYIKYKGPFIYYVIQIWGPGRPPPPELPLCNIVINWGDPPVCNIVINREDPSPPIPYYVIYGQPLKITITQLYIVNALIHHKRLPQVRPRQNIENITPAFFDKCPHDEPADWRSFRLNNTLFTLQPFLKNSSSQIKVLFPQERCLHLNFKHLFIEFPVEKDHLIPGRPIKSEAY